MLRWAWTQWRSAHMQEHSRRTLRFCVPAWHGSAPGMAAPGIKAARPCMRMQRGSSEGMP